MTAASTSRKKLVALRKKFAGEKTMTGQVRAAMKHLGEFGFLSLENLVPQHTDKRIRGVIKAFKKTGEIVSVRPGLYGYREVEKQSRRTALDVIWHLVRSHRQFSTDDIERLSGAKRETVLEYLHCLRRMEFIRQVKRGVWQLIEDPGPETPVNTAKCARLKRIRKTGKGAV